METARRTRISLFLCISLPSLHDYNVKGPNFTFCGGREQDNDFLFLFLDFGTDFGIHRHRCCLLLKPPVKGWYPMSRNFNVRTRVKVTFANKIEAMHERSLVSVKVEHRSTFKLSTFYVIKILRALTCVANLRQWKSTLTDATWLTNNSQHCWMLHVASVCTSCCMHVVGSFCAEFETGKTCCVRLQVALSSLISVR